MQGSKLCALLLVLAITSTAARHHYKHNKDHRDHKQKSKARETYDQQQTGEYNVRLNLKDFQIIALMNDDSFGDYDYAYDYSELTVKPVNPIFTASTATKGPTTLKPTTEASPEATSKQTEGSTQSTPISSELPSTTIKPEEDPKKEIKEVKKDVKDDLPHVVDLSRFILRPKKRPQRPLVVPVVPVVPVVVSDESNINLRSVGTTEKVQFVSAGQENALEKGGEKTKEEAENNEIIKKKEEGETIKDENIVKTTKPEEVEGNMNIDEATKEKLIELKRLLSANGGGDFILKDKIIPSQDPLLLTPAAESNDGLKLVTDFDNKKPYFSLLETLRMRRCSNGFVRNSFGRCRRLTRRRGIPTSPPVFNLGRLN